MNNILCDLFLNICIDHFENSLKHDKDAPKSILIVFGTAESNKKPFLLKKKEAVFHYFDKCLRKSDINTKPNFTEAEDEMHFKEAYAELGYTKNDTAYMTILFGKRYGAQYRYRIISENGKPKLTDEKLIGMF